MTRAASGILQIVILVALGALVVSVANPVMNLLAEAGGAWAGETRHGLIANRTVAVAIASVAGEEPHLAAGAALDRADAGLFAFDGAGEQRAEIVRAPIAVDVVWLDARLGVVGVTRELDLSYADVPARSPYGEDVLFALVVPGGFAADLGVGRGDRLTLI